MIKNLKRYLIYPLVLFSLFGCKELEFIEKDFSQTDDYDVFIYVYPGKMSSIELIIGEYSDKKKKFKEAIQAIDWEADGRIDEFVLYAPKGSKLEKFASIEKLNEVIEAVLENKNIEKKVKK